MTQTHVVKQGECLYSLARRYGFASAESLYERQSAAFREERPDPGVLFPGDELQIPDKKPREEPCQTDRRHVFVVRRPRTHLRIQLEDCYGPHGGRRYVLNVGDDVHEGTTDEQGWLEELVRVDATEGDLSLWLADDQHPLQLKVRFGYLDPPDQVSGAQGRLTNLGFRCGAVDGDLGERTEAALRDYQRARELEVTGKLDEATRACLADESEVDA